MEFPNGSEFLSWTVPPLNADERLPELGRLGDVEFPDLRVFRLVPGL